MQRTYNHRAPFFRRVFHSLLFQRWKKSGRWLECGGLEGQKRDNHSSWWTSFHNGSSLLPRAEFPGATRAYCRPILWTLSSCHKVVFEVMRSCSWWGACSRTLPKGLKIDYKYWPFYAIPYLPAKSKSLELVPMLHSSNFYVPKIYECRLGSSVSTLRHMNSQNEKNIVQKFPNIFHHEYFCYPSLLELRGTLDLGNYEHYWKYKWLFETTTI